MKVYHTIESIEKIRNAVVTIGTFDGVHLAHQTIIKRVQTIVQETDGETVVVTFFPHPRIVLDPDAATNLKLLNTIKEKIAQIERNGIQHLVLIPFTKEFAETSSEVFTQEILVDKIGTKKLVIGYDHRFGKNRTGGLEYLKANATTFGFEVEEIPRQEIDETTISSSSIRKHLLDGEYQAAIDLLGYRYSLTGVVVKGAQMGRTIGYPTANIFIKETYKLIPADGVFAVKVRTEIGEFGGMLNIGNRPTMNGVGRTIEVNIFDFDADIYDQTISVELVAFIRKEQKFNGLEALKVQLAQDKIAAKVLLAQID